MDLHKFDKRIIQRLIQQGIVSSNEYKAYKENLENLEKKCENIMSKIFVDKN